jgi:hypothetical protein
VLTSYTIDCLGTIGPDSFTINERGYLRRGFDHCPNQDKRQSIDDILGLQHREKVFPHAKECMAGRWAEWKRDFARSGVVACPRWEKRAAINAPTMERMSVLSRDFRAAKTASATGIMSLEAGARLSRQAEQNHVFEVSFPDGGPAQSCGSPAACAAQCAGAFPSFVVSAEGSKVVGDPAYWLADDVYDDADSDPFWQDGYFHPMSYFGPLPGVLIGHRARAYLGEPCSYFDGSLHLIINLPINCLDDTEITSCVSLCLPDGDPLLSGP